MALKILGIITAIFLCLGSTLCLCSLSPNLLLVDRRQATEDRVLTVLVNWHLPVSHQGRRDGGGSFPFVYNQQFWTEGSQVEMENLFKSLP